MEKVDEEQIQKDAELEIEKDVELARKLQEALHKNLQEKTAASTPTFSSVKKVFQRKKMMAKIGPHSKKLKEIMEEEEDKEKGPEQQKEEG